MNSKVWCEDCRWSVKESDSLRVRCGNKNHIDSYRPPYVYMVRPTTVECADYNRFGECSQFEIKKSVLVLIKEFFSGEKK